MSLYEINGDDLDRYLMTPLDADGDDPDRAAHDALVADFAEQDAYDASNSTFTELAAYTIETIQRDGESVAETVNRILESLAATAPDFDHFYGEPSDGRGPSGGVLEPA